MIDSEHAISRKAGSPSKSMGGNADFPIPAENDSAPSGVSGEFIDRPRMGLWVVESELIWLDEQGAGGLVESWTGHPMDTGPVVPGVRAPGGVCRVSNGYPFDSGFRVTSVDELGNWIAPGRAE